jgi:serine/threonine protein kinase
VSKGTQLNNDQKAKFEQVLKSVESEWSRLSRVRPSIDAFDIENKLGSGGFGVVNMVREKQTGAVYAMKVCPLEALTKSISKDKTLRLGHEGRVLCERDLLKKASESGSIWICKLHYAFQDTQALYILFHAVNEADI